MSRPATPTATAEGTESDAQYVARLAEELEAEFQRLGPDTVIAFMAETVVGATLGCVTALPGYFPAMQAVCDRHGALLILDEVMSGMGRCGTLHAWEAGGRHARISRSSPRASAAATSRSAASWCMAGWSRG